MYPELESAPKECKHCRDYNWRLKRMIDSAGRERYAYFCVSCNKHATAFCSAKLARNSSLLIDGDIVMPQTKGHCEKCNTFTYLEKHHWAPYKYFGDEADKWPTSMLCRGCHEEWHQKMTEDLIRKK